MRTVAHVSDLHFGREDPLVVAGLAAELERLRPSLVVASGDLTQRARRAQFAAAARFLRALPSPLLVVPGNHDLPLFDVVRRLLSPRGRYRRYITPDLAPVFDDGELFVLGLDTARPWRWKDGAIAPAQIATLRERFARARDHALRLLVTHHPLAPRPGDPQPALVTRGPETLRAAAECRVDLALAGHLHQGSLADVRPAGDGSRAVLVMQAGTAVSNRRRHEPNSYNLLTLDLPHLGCDIRVWDGRAFATRESLRYVRRAGEWVRD